MDKLTVMLHDKTFNVEFSDKAMIQLLAHSLPLRKITDLIKKNSEEIIRIQHPEVFTIVDEIAFSGTKDEKNIYIDKIIQ